MPERSFIKVFMAKFLLFLLFFANYAVADEGPGNNFEINHANNLQILSNKFILSGSVSVSSLGSQKFTLTTDKMVSVKDRTGQFGNIETFGPSTISSPEFNLKAQKIYFVKDGQTGDYNLMKALGQVIIKSPDGGELNAPKVNVKLDQNKLFASGGVQSTQIIEEDGEKQKAIINSREQEIDLKPSPNQLSKQIIAKKSVITTLEQAVVSSELAELFTLKGKAHKAIFTGEANLKTQDGDRAQGHKITYYLTQNKLLEVQAKYKNKNASLQSADGTFMEGYFIKFNPAQNLLLVSGSGARLERIDGTKLTGSSIKYNTETQELNLQESRTQALLKVPNKNEDGTITYIIIQANSIINDEVEEGKTLLVAKQNQPGHLVQIEFGNRRGWGEELLIKQDSKTPEQKEDILLLIGRAKLIDDKQTLRGPAIQIGLGQKNLFSGFSGRAKGTIPLKKKLN